MSKPTLGDLGIILAFFGLLINLPADTTELLQEDLLGMLGSLCLNVAHDLTPLTEIKLCPIANVHLEYIRLREFDLGRRDEFQVLILDQRCLCNSLSSNRMLDLHQLIFQQCLLLLCLFLQLISHLFPSHAEVLLALFG